MLNLLRVVLEADKAARKSSEPVTAITEETENIQTKTCCRPQKEIVFTKPKPPPFGGGFGYMLLQLPRIVRAFLGDGNIMRVAFLQPRVGDADELCRSRAGR